jgi:hypothetical protein
MKSYLCFLLFVVIFCNTVEKKEENYILKEDPNVDEFLQKVLNIAKNCNMDVECIVGQLMDLFQNLPEEQQKEIINLILGDNCNELCETVLSEELGSTAAGLTCDALCSSL